MDRWAEGPASKAAAAPRRDAASRQVLPDEPPRRSGMLAGRELPPVWPVQKERLPAVRPGALLARAARWRLREPPWVPAGLVPLPAARLEAPGAEVGLQQPALLPGEQEPELSARLARRQAPPAPPRQAERVRVGLEQATVRERAPR